MFQCYKRILELDPVNIQGLHNLCVVFVERGKLLEAQTCLEHAHTLAPEEDYVLRHLQIVKNRIAKLKINPNDNQNSQSDLEEDNKVISNNSSKSIDETERSTQPVVSKSADNQLYSSHVVNTEPVFVKNAHSHNYIENIYSEEERDEQYTDLNNSNGKNMRKASLIGSDDDDPSSGMS